jgi:hypothetical protein
MSGPHYARLVSRVLEVGGRGPVPPPTPENRASAIALLEAAITRRAQAKKRTRWVVSLSATATAAAIALLTVGGVRWYAHRDKVVTAAAPAQTEVRVVGHAVAGAASVVVAGEAAPVTEGRPIVPGSRVVAAKSSRVLLAFSTGANALLEDGGDVTWNAGAAAGAGAQQLRLDSGSIDLHASGTTDDPRFLVRTPDAEIDSQGTHLRVSVVPADPSCGGGTTTRVAVTEGSGLVRHGGSESRVGPGEQWPAGCFASPAAATAAAPSGARAPTGSTLAEQNDLFAQAIAAKRRGDTSAAVAGFDRFLARYPGSALAESATVERMRLLRAGDPSRAVTAAKAYLNHYPNGFAHSEAEALVAGSR